MEPVTHLLTGACLARTGLNRKAAYVTVAMAIAAEFPDIDTLWGLQGPVAAFRHHRGITHTLVALPFEAALLTMFFVGVHALRRQRARTRRRPLKTASPVHWKRLFLYLLLALGSHLLLDFTNNYGLRPFFPFNPRWYNASLVFIFDPLIFLLLLAALLAPALFALVGAEVSGQRQVFRGAAWARAALCGVLIVWGLRFIEHHEALALAELQTLRAPVTAPGHIPTGEQEAAIAPELSRPLLRAQHVLASPDPINPFRWYTAADYGPAYLLGTADTLRHSLESGRELDKPAPNRWIVAAESSPLGRVYLDWSAMPWLTVDGLPASGRLSPGTDRPSVSLQDLRFLGGSSLMRRGSTPPLTGRVSSGPDGEMTEESLDGKAEK